MPIREKKETPTSKLAKSRLEEIIKRTIRSENVKIKMEGDDRAIIAVDKKYIPRIIGRKGENISELEKRTGLKLDVEEADEEETTDNGEKNVAGIEIKNKIIYIDVGKPNRHVKIFLDDVPVLQALSSSKGIIRIKLATEVGKAIYDHIKEGGKVYFTE